MRVLAVENYAGTHLGLVGRALDEAGAAVDLRRMQDGDPLPSGDDGYDGLVVLGGAQNALADEAHPYLWPLAQLTARFGAADKAVLGICLGAQIVARGHGGRNLIGRPIEIGWSDVTTTDAGRADPVIATLGERAPLFHWHSDSFELPPGAAHLAASLQTPNQAFRLGRAVYGVQFHFEADTTLVAEWIGSYRGMLDRDAPAFAATYAAQAAALGPVADRVGLDIARAWVAMV